MRCIAWPRVALAALMVGALTGVALPLAMRGARASLEGAVVDAAQVAAAIVAGMLVSTRQRWLHAWVTFFASLFVASALSIVVARLA